MVYTFCPSQWVFLTNSDNEQKFQMVNGQQHGLPFHIIGEKGKLWSFSDEEQPLTL